MPEEKESEELVPIRMASDCIECPDGCDEVFCPEHKEHYADCACLGPSNAEDDGYEIVEREGRLYGRKLPEKEPQKE